MGVKFSYTISAEQLAKGLRPFAKMPKNSGYLVTSDGAVGRDKILQTIDSLSRIDTSIITDGFPYPQLFVCTNLIIVCGRTKIYELINGSLVLKSTVNPGSTWNVIDFHEYVYMSNGRVAVVRDSGSFEYSITTVSPVFHAGCNYNGQVIIGAPDVVTIYTGVTPNTASLSLSTYTPKIMNATASAYFPVSLALTLSIFAPSAVITDNKTAFPDTAVLPITPYAPSLNLIMIPTDLSLTTATYTPVLTLAAQPNNASLTITTYEPIPNYPVNPVVGGLVITRYAPILTPVPTTKELTISSYEPVLDFRFRPDKLDLFTTKYEPVITNFLSPNTKNLVIVAYIPIVLIGFVPDTLAMSITAYAPMLNADLTPNTLFLSTTAYPPNTTVTSDDEIGKIGNTSTAGATFIMQGFAPDIGNTSTAGATFIMQGFAPDIGNTSTAEGA